MGACRNNRQPAVVRATSASNQVASNVYVNLYIGIHISKMQPGTDKGE